MNDVHGLMMSDQRMKRFILYDLSNKFEDAITFSRHGQLFANFGDLIIFWGPAWPEQVQALLNEKI